MSAQFLFVVHSPSHSTRERRVIKSRAAVHAALNSQERRRKALCGKASFLADPGALCVPKTIGSFGSENHPEEDDATVIVRVDARPTCRQSNNVATLPPKNDTVDPSAYKCSIPKRASPSPVANDQPKFTTGPQRTERPGWGQDDYADMQFFMQVLSSGLRPTSDAAFFNIVVPCLTHSDVGIRELALAIGSTQRRAFAPDTCTGTNVHAIKRCNKAINHLLGLGQTAPNEILQASSILLASLHILQMDIKTARRYTRAAQRLCQMDEEDRENRRFFWARVVANPHADQNYKRSTFADVIANTVAKAVTELQASCVEMSAASLRAEGALRWTSPVLHRSINDRYDLLGSIENLMPLIQKMKSDLAYGAVIDPTSCFAQDLRARVGHIGEIIHSLRSQDLASASAAGILLTNNSWPSIVLRCQILAGSEMAYDNETNSFDDVLRGPEFEIEQPGGLMMESTFVFYPFIGIIVRPCFFVAVHCRDPHIRRRAINMLFSRRRNESGMDSWISGLVATALMNIEEKGRVIQEAAEITESDRVMLRGFDYDAATSQYRLLYTPATAASSNARTILPWPLNIPVDPLGIVPLHESELMLELLSTLHTFVAQATSEDAPDGAIVPIFYEGEQVDVQWLNQPGLSRMWS